MANIVIVTDQCYLLCEAINYIAVNEVDEDDRQKLSYFDKPKTKSRRIKKPTKKQLDALDKKQVHIIIDFIPVAGTNVNNNSRRLGSNPDSTTVAITVTGKDRCLNLFSHMVEQIREQIPDHMFLDKLVDKFIQETKV